MPKIPEPIDPRNAAAVEVLKKQRKEMGPRQFRDALTRASGATYGLYTDVKNQNRWDR